MWNHVCTSCDEVSTTATQCFWYAGEKFDRATWVETCDKHAEDCRMIVSIMDITCFTKAVRA